MSHLPQVAMLIGRFYPVESGAEIQCKRLSQALLRRGARVFVLTQRLPGTASFETVEDVPVHRIGLPLKNRMGSLTYLTSGLWWLWKKRKDYDVLHVHIASAPAVLAAIAARLYGKRSIVKIACSREGGEVATSSATWYGRLKLALLRRLITLFVCPSGEIKKELAENGFDEHRVQVIFNGVDTARFASASCEERSALRARLGLSPDERVVLYIGRIDPVKGITELLAAAEQVAGENGGKLRLLLLGEGPLLADMKARFDGTGAVRFLGWQKDTLSYLKAADVFVLPSYAEGLPNALIEAMSCGLPCVATNIGGTNELVADGVSGLLVPPKDADALASALRRFMNEPSFAQECGRQARRFIEEQLAIERIAERYGKLYAALRKGSAAWRNDEAVSDYRQLP